jgi:hypothetical protein
MHTPLIGVYVTRAGETIRMMQAQDTPENRDALRRAARAYRAIPGNRYVVVRALKVA